MIYSKTMAEPVLQGADGKCQCRIYTSFFKKDVDAFIRF